MTRSLTGLLLALAAVSATGCYTVLRAPGGFTTPQDPAYSATWEEPEDRDPRIGRFSDERGLHTPGYDSYGSGYPIFGYDSRYGMYGFGSPFAYGPGYGYGYGYPYGGYGRYGYSPYHGPYGYGYDPYYSRGSYVPPGYELVTTTELSELRAGLTSRGPTSETPTVDETTLRERQRQSQERAWTQRVEPTVRRSTVGQRTTKPPTSTSSSSKSSGTVSSSGSSKPASEEKSSGSSAAKRRKKRR